MIKSFFQFCVETIIDVKPTYVTYSKPTKVKPLATVPPKQPPIASTSTSNKSSTLPVPVSNKSSTLPVPVLRTIYIKPQKALPGPNKSLVKPSEKSLVKPSEKPPIDGEIIKPPPPIDVDKEKDKIKPPPPIDDDKEKDKIKIKKDDDDHDDHDDDPIPFFVKGKGLHGKALTGAPQAPLVYGHRYGPGVSFSLRRIPR